MAEWISVYDKLPEKGQRVIVHDGDEKRTWDVGQYQGYMRKVDYWYWKKKTTRTVKWWMLKDGALPDVPRVNKNG